MADQRENETHGKVNCEDLGSCLTDWSSEELAELCPYLSYHRFSPDTPLWHRGDAGTFGGFLVKGKLLVKREARFPGKNILLAILEDGSVFGEKALVCSSERSSTVVAAEESETLHLSRDKAQEFFEKNPLLGLKLLKNVLNITTIRLQQTGFRLAELL